MSFGAWTDSMLGQPSPISPERSAAMTAVAVALGDSFNVLVALLPDNHFQLAEEQQTHCWQECLHRVNRGETAPHRLVRIFDHPDGLFVF